MAVSRGGTYNEGTNIDSEIVGDLAGQYIFDEDFVSHLAYTERNVAQKILAWIKHQIKMVTAGSPEARRLEQGRYLYEKALDEAAKQSAKVDGVRKYALSANARNEVSKVLADKFNNTEVKLTDTSPSILLSQKGVRNLPMLMNASHIRENILTAEEAKQRGLKVNPNINYHGLGDKLFLNVIDGLDDVSEAYRGTKNAEDTSRRENYFLLVSQYTDAEGNIINIPVHINEKGQYNRVFIDTNKIATVFGRNEFRRYIKEQLNKGNLVRIKRKSTQTSEPTSLINAGYGTNASENSIPQKKDAVNRQFSLSTDSDGKQLTEGQREYFKDSKVVDVDNANPTEDVDMRRSLYNEDMCFPGGAPIETEQRRLDVGEDIAPPVGESHENAIAPPVPEKVTLDEGDIAPPVQQAAEEASKENVEALVQKSTAQTDGVRYSLRDVHIPTREELNNKPAISVVDISEPLTTGTFAQRRAKINERISEIISKPYLNKDTQVMIFLTPKSFSHAFHNAGELQINAVEHIPELIENAVLTHVEENTHGSEYADAVYTFFAATKAERIYPVKLKVKEYIYRGQDLPQNIKQYFEVNSQEYAALYDTVVLQVEEITENSFGSAKDMNQNDPFLNPKELSTISVAELLDLVKGSAEKYIPQNSLSDEGEQIAPTGNYNVYGKDVALVGDDIAPPVVSESSESVTKSSESEIAPPVPEEAMSGSGVRLGERDSVSVGRSENIAPPVEAEAVAETDAQDIAPPVPEERMDMRFLQGEDYVNPLIKMPTSTRAMAEAQSREILNSLAGSPVHEAAETETKEKLETPTTSIKERTAFGGS